MNKKRSALTLVQVFFLLKNLANPPRAVALRPCKDQEFRLGLKIQKIDFVFLSLCVVKKQYSSTIFIFRCAHSPLTQKILSAKAL